MNCDDYYEPVILSRILGIFRTLPQPTLLVGNCKVLDDDEKVVYLNKPSRLSLINILIGGDKNQFPYNPSAYFDHKSLHNRIGLYDVSLHYTMDLDFILKAVKTTHIRYVDEMWGNYRYIKGTKTYQAKEDNLHEPNKAWLMELHLKKLPWIQQWWIKSARFVFIEQKPRYYFGRMMDYSKDPQEVPKFLLKKLRNHSEQKIATIVPSVNSREKVLN